MRTIEEVAWFAGLFEGEGTLSRCRPLSNSAWRMSMRMTDEDIIERVHKVWGGQMYSEGIRGHDPKMKNVKPSWLWQLGSQSAINEVVRTIYPFMGIRRRAKMDEFLVYFDSGCWTKSAAAKRRSASPEYRAKWYAARFPHLVNRTIQ